MRHFDRYPVNVARIVFFIFAYLSLFSCDRDCCWAFLFAFILHEMWDGCTLNQGFGDRLTDLITGDEIDNRCVCVCVCLRVRFDTHESKNYATSAGRHALALTCEHVGRYKTSCIFWRLGWKQLSSSSSSSSWSATSKNDDQRTAAQSMPRSQGLCCMVVDHLIWFDFLYDLKDFTV